jgi:DNA-binding transcriptional regulator YiaG
MQAAYKNCTMEPVVKVNLISGENALKQIREALGMSQRKFAEAIGVNHSTIFRWENGQTKPMFSVAQVKALEREMWKVGLVLQDLPDDL